MSRSLVSAVDDLYRAVVTEPERWGEEAFADWLEATTLDGGTMDGVRARELRRAVRAAVKLQRFWASADPGKRGAEPSWQARVDLALGVPAWRPTLALAMHDLHVDPSQEAFDAVGERFRLVNGAPWLDGVSFTEWNAARAGSDEAR